MAVRYVIVPVYNEEKYLGKFLDSLLTVSRNVIVVNDGSSDRTRHIAESRGVICLNHIVNLGKGAAMKTGCEYAFRVKKADSVIVMDGDDQHDPADIAKFDIALRKGVDIALGVRSLDANMPLGRVIGNKSMSILINLLFHHYIADILSGYKAFTKNAYRRITWYSPGYEVETEIAVRIAKQNISYTEIPINTVYRGKDYGFNLLDAWRILMKIPYWLWR